MPEPKLSVAEFAAKVKSKYPQYADVDDSLLVGKMVEKYPVYADQVNLDVKKKESSEASDSLSSEEISASVTSAEVPAPFGEVPKFDGTKDKEPPKTRQQVIEEQRAAQAQKFADIGSYVGQSIAEGVVSANTFLNRAVETLLLGNNTNYFSSNSAKLLEPLNQEKERLQSEYVGEETVGKGIVETFQENPLTGAKLIAFEAGRQVPQMYAMGAIGRATMAAEGATAAGLRTGSILAPRTKLVKKIAEDVAPMVPLGMSSAGQAYLDAAEKNPEDDFIDAVTNLAIATYKGTGEIASELMFRTSVDDLIRGGFRKGLVSDIAKSTRPTLQAAKQVGKDVAVEGFQEGLEELAVEISSNAMDALVFGEDMFSKSNVYGMADAFILGSAIGSPITLLSKGPSAIGTANNINKRRNISEEINDLYDVHQDPNTGASEKAVVKGQIINKLAELKQVEDGLASFYEEFTKEDRDKVIKLNQQLSMAQLIYPEQKSEKSKDAIQDLVKAIYSEKTKIESKYDPNIKVYEYDSQKETGVPSPVVQGEAIIEAQPIEGAGQEAPEAGRVLQVSVEQEPVVIGDLINKRVTYSDPVSGTLVEGDLFQEGQRLIVESDQGQQFDLGNADELSNETLAGSTLIQPATESVIPQQDGSFVYNLKGDQKIPYQTRLFNREEGLRSIKRDKEGNISRVTLQSEDGTQTFNLSGQQAEDAAYYIMRDFVQRAENAESIEQLIQRNNEARTEIEQATITPEVAVPTQEAAAEVTEAVAVEPTVGAVEEVVEVRPKNRNNLSDAEVTEAVSQADRLAKRLGLPVTIITHNSRKEYNENVSAVSKASLDKAGVESGRFIPSRNEIHLNLEDMNAVVPFHEVFHAAFINRFAKGSQKTRQKTAEDFYSGLIKILRNGNEQDQLLADAADSFVKSGNYTPEETPEEFMAQVAGFISTSGERISKSTMDKLIQWLNNFIGKISPNLKINSRGEFIDFMNSFSGALFYSQADKTNAIDKLGEMEEGTVPLTEEPVDVSPEVLQESSSRKANYRNTYIPNKYIVDPEKVFEDFRKDNGRDPKVWIWMSDQLKRGEYFNPKSGVRMDLEGGIGFAFDSDNQKKNIVWASGLSDKTLNERTKDADFIWFMSGSPKSSFNFSKGTTKAFFAEIESGMQNVKGQTIEGVEIKDGSFDEFVAVVNAIYDANSGKNWVNADKWTNLRKYLNDSKKGLIDKPIRKFVVENMMHEGEGKSMQIPVQKFLHETLGVPQKDVFHSLLRDEALVKNNVRNGDLTLIVKPTGIIRGSNVHDTYPTAITGEIVGMPDKLYSVLDVIPEEAKTVISRQTGLPIPNASPTTQIKNAVGDVGRIYKATELQAKQVQKVYDDILEESSSKSFEELAAASKAGLLIHATKSEFDTFDPEKLYGAIRMKYGYGFYFTSRASKASDYGNKFIFTPLNKYNFLDIDAKADNDFANELKSLAETKISKLQGVYGSIDSIPESLKTPLDNALKISSIISGDSKYGKYSIDNLRKFLEGDYVFGYRDFSEAMLSVGYDGFQTDDFYEAVIFNFEKLNDNLVKDEADYLKESSSRDVRAEILDKEQESFADRAKRTATSFVWSPTQKKIRVFKERMSSQLSVEGREIKKFVKKLNTLINKADTETIDLVNKVFDGTLTPQDQKKLESKPSGSLIFGQANAMRNYIDSFADDFVNSPEFHALPEETVNTILENFGQYMRGSYRFWKDKDFKPSNEARRDAIVYEYEILRAKSIGELVKLSGLTEAEADVFFEQLHDDTLAQATKAIDEYIAEIEKIRNGDDFKKLGIVSPSSIKLPSEQFMRRKELPETIQSLLGKETDPIIRFIDTTIALSNIKYKGHMLYAISESLGGTSFIKNEITKAELDSKEYREVKDKFSPLNGRFVHKDVYEAITDQKIYDSDRLWLVPYFTMLKLARKSKVIYNLPTWRKNLTGGWYTMAANGVVNPEFIIDLKRRAELFAKGETDAETEALIKIMGDNGIIGQDVNANILGFTSAIYSRAMTGNDSDYQNYVKKAKDIIKNFDTVIGQKYSAVDDYTKLIIFRSEIQSFAKKLYGKSYDSLTESQKNKVHAEAAEFVKQNTPTFSRLPKWYASLARIPAGDFLSFEFESLRSFSANIRNGHQDLMKGMNDASLSKEQKDEYLKAGAKRLAGSSAILATRLAITSILASAALGDDDELEDDIKNNRPNWMEGHSIIPVKISKDGIATVYDYSMEDPYGSFFDLATDPLSFPAYAVDLLKPNMGISFAMNLIENKDFYGRDITNSYDDPLTKGFKYTDHTLRSLILPPFISSTLRDEQKRAEVEADKYSRLDAVGRFASRAIIRDYEYNIGTQFYFFTDQFRTKKEQYIDLTGASRSNRLAELDEIKKMYQSIVNIGIKKGNYEMIASANKNVKRALKPAEEAYVLYGYEIPEQE